MELLLNYVWVMLAGAALGLFLVAPAKNRRCFAALGVLFCAVLLLFPAISVSDDLHFQAFVSEDLNATKRLSSVAAHAAVPQQSAVLMAVAAFVLACLSQTLWSVLGAISARRVSLFHVRPIPGRAPPALSLA